MKVLHIFAFVFALQFSVLAQQKITINCRNITAISCGLVQQLNDGVILPGEVLKSIKEVPISLFTDNIYMQLLL